MCDADSPGKRELTPMSCGVGKRELTPIFQVERVARPDVDLGGAVMLQNSQRGERGGLVEAIDGDVLQYAAQGAVVNLLNASIPEFSIQRI
jgi:hypothetical protein